MYLAASRIKSSPIVKAFLALAMLCAAALSSLEFVDVVAFSDFFCASFSLFSLGAVSPSAEAVFKAGPLM